MNRKLSRLNISLVAGTLIVMMMLLSGCESNSPRPTSIPSCNISSFERLPGFVPSAVISYLRARYPEQSIPVEDTWEGTGNDHHFDKNWTLAINCLAPCQAVVINQISGFRWQGEIYWSRGQFNYQYCYWEGKVDRIVELSMTLPNPSPTKPSPIPLAKPTSIPQHLPEPCKMPEPSPFIMRAALEFVANSYPKLGIADLEWRSKARQVTTSGIVETYTAGKWIVTIEQGFRVTLANDTTGFQWKGQVQLHADPVQCKYVVDRVSQISITLPP